MEKLAIGGLILILIFFTQVTPEKVERELEKALRKSLTAKSVDVELEGSPGFPTLQGKFKSLTIRVDGLSFSGGQLLEMLPIRFTDKPEKEGRVGKVVLSLHESIYEGLTISELEAHAYDVRFDLKGSVKEKRLVLLSATSGTLSGFISSNSTQKYLANQAIKHGIESLKVQLKHETVEIEGMWKVELAGANIAKIPFNAIAELFPTGNEIRWRLKEARIAELIPLPSGWVQGRLQNFNPLIRFDLSPIQVQIKNLKVLPEGIYIFAEFSLSRENLRDEQVELATKAGVFYPHQPF
ncbi:MAG: DUF2993 domain-containing protein [Armatimonadetes bacterium]|nr:DUF2993 domain-containing protein [Armatimonadota bacterium]MDW8028417.1 DUF2993 domain-containing protein [Armatimonadota bacterium]